ILTFFSISYWLIPVLSKRVFTPLMNRLAIIQTILWVVGMLLMGGLMHIVGLMGAPRRTAHSTFGDHELALKWMSYTQSITVGGILLIIAIVLILYIW